MKYQKLSEIMTEVISFTNKHNIEIEVSIFKLGELRNESEEQSSNWARFEKYAGTYCFFNDQERVIEYIGMSMSNTGARLFNWLFQDLKIESKLNDNDTILIVSFTNEHYMAPALESYLIDKFNPKFNKKR